MRAVFLLAFRNLASRKSRTLLTVLGISIGIATALAVFILDYNTLVTMKILALSGYGTPDIEVASTTADSSSFRSMLATLRQKPSIHRVTPLFFTPLFLSLPDRSEGIEIAGVEPDASGWFGGYHVTPKGEDLTVGGGHVILLTERFSQKMHIEIGDTVRFVERPDIPFRVIGLVSNWKLGTRNNGNFGIVPFWDGWRTFHKQSLAPFCWVRKGGDTSIDEIRAEIELDYVVTLPAHVLAGETGDEKVMRDGVRISGILTLIIGLYLVFSSLSMAVAERIREIGLLQAIGTTDRQIMMVFVLEAGIMAGLGGLIGLMGGISLTWVLMKLGFSSIGTGQWVWTFWLPRQRIGMILLLGVGSAMIGALYPLLKASRISVVEALKQRGLQLEFVLSRRLYGLFILAFVILVPMGYLVLSSLLEMPWREGFSLVISTVLLFAGLLGIIFLGPPIIGALVRLVSWPVTRIMLCEGFLVERALSRATDRIAASLCTLAIVFAGLIGLKHMTMSLKVQSQEWVENALTNKVFVATRLLTPPEYKRFADISGVQALSPMSFTIRAPFLIRGIPAESFSYGPLSRDSAFLNAYTSSPSLLVSSQLAHNMGVAPGDSITLNSRDGPVAFTILAITDEYGYYLDDRAYGVMNLSKMVEFARVDTSVANLFTLAVEDNVSEAQVKNELLAGFGDYIMYIATGEDKKIWTLSGIDRDFVIFEIILAITAILAGIGVTNALLIGALERRREFGLLQALGITPAQLGRIVMLEGAVIGLVGGILGAVLGIPLSWIIIDGLKLLSQLDLIFILSPFWVGVSIITAVIVSTAAGLYPTIRTVRAPVTESLQYE